MLIVPLQPHAGEAGGFVIISTLPLFLVIFGIYIPMGKNMRVGRFWLTASGLGFAHGLLIAWKIYLINVPGG